MAKVSTIDIITAAEEGRCDLVKEWINKDPESINARTDLGMTPIHRAARFGHADIVKELLKAGVKPTIRDARRNTPLHDAACEETSLYALHILLQAGCLVDVKNSRGDTPLMVACAFSNLPAVAYLLKSGANPTIRNRLRMNARDWTELQFNAIVRKRGYDWKGHTRALESIVSFLEDALRDC